MIDGSKYTGAELLRKYRECNVNSFILHRALLEEMEDFIYQNIDDHVMAIDVFTNDSGKWIVIKTYTDNGAINREVITAFCKEYGVTLDHITKEVNVDYEGNKSKGNSTYLFEIIK